MRKLVALLAGLTLAAAACGDSGGGAGGSIDSCDDLGVAGLDLFQDALDEVADMSMTDFIALSESEETPEFLANLETRGNELDAKQTELGCTDEELGAYVIDNIDRLDATGPVAELILEFIKADPDSLTFGN